MQYCVRLPCSKNTATALAHRDSAEVDGRRERRALTDVDIGSLRLHVYGGRFGAQDVKLSEDVPGRGRRLTSGLAGKGRRLAAQGIAEGTYLPVRRRGPGRRAVRAACTATQRIVVALMETRHRRQGGRAGLRLHAGAVQRNARRERRALLRGGGASVDSGRGHPPSRSVFDYGRTGRLRVT